MKKFLKWFSIIFVVLCVVYVSYRFIPISKNPNESIIDYKRTEDSYEYNGKVYNDFIGVDDDLYNGGILDNRDEIPWLYFTEFQNGNNVKEVYPKKYTTLRDKLLKRRYYILNDDILVYDTGSNFMARYFIYKSNDINLTMPEFSDDNIEEITQYVGIGAFEQTGYLNNIEPYIIKSQSLKKSEIDDFVKELNNNSNVNKLISRVKAEDKNWDSYQEKFENYCDENGIEYTEYDKVEVFYKIKFKDDAFPLNLVIYEQDGYEENETATTTAAVNEEEIVLNET